MDDASSSSVVPGSVSGPLSVVAASRSGTPPFGTQKRSTKNTVATQASIENATSKLLPGTFATTSMMPEQQRRINPWSPVTGRAVCR